MAFLNRWDPFTEIARLQDEMSRQFLTPERRAAGFVPLVDINEDKDAIYVKAELPGVKPDQVQLQVENDLLTISGERKSEQRQQGEGYVRVERATGSFSRSLVLPEGVDPDGIQARFDAGVLEVSIAKPEERKPRRVAINVARKADVIEGAESNGAVHDADAAAV